jgi:hypothetical protein
MTHILPYRADERLTVSHQYGSSGQLEAITCLHEIREGAFDGKKVSDFRGAPVHSNVLIAGVLNPRRREF